MRKVLIAALAAAVATVGITAIAGATAGQDNTSWDFTLKPNKVNRAASSNSLIEPSKIENQGTADTSDDVYTPTERTTIIFPKGSAVDTSALGRCGLTPSDVGRGEDCPNRTRLGDGAAVSVVGGTPTGNNQRQGGSKVNATIDAYNQRKGILFVVQPCGGGTGPTTSRPCDPAGSPIVLQGNWSNVKRKPKLVVPTPPGLLAIGVVIVRFELNTDKHTKSVRRRGNRVLKSFVFTPRTCNGKWKTQAKAQYSDGTRQTIKDDQNCKQPRRR